MIVVIYRRILLLKLLALDKARKNNFKIKVGNHYL